MSNSWFRTIGDVHGERSVYRRLIQDVPYTLQLGDLDFRYDFLKDIDPEKHKFVPGNHDNYDELSNVRNCLGDFGVWSVPDFGDVFYVRGAWSIDWRARVTHDQYRDGKLVRSKDMWQEEEMTNEQCYRALELYQQVKPKFVVSHTAPLNIVQHVTNPMMTHSWGYSQSVIQTKTSVLLQSMTDAHRPRVHVFGHFHCPLNGYFDGQGNPMPSNSDKKEYTQYICVDVLGCADFPKNFVNDME